ncbi:hypothetical protein FKR81_00330 [Lentzea tibetensis]|uniref:Uncharacterized protein n=1 Tax=Lentzea tibetensis TaxID=2591470 RepID=A0A563F2B6_9PSEU|nr:hypothetical protein [Lentzea tibetensis]TWP54053.1 hypothetical protein FKR81_00330 [Lentzea tibetensis]
MRFPGWRTIGKSGPMRWFVIVVVVAVFVAGGWFAYHGVTSEVAGTAVPTPPPTFESPDRKVQLRVPDGAMDLGTEVRFSVPGPEVVEDLNKSARGVTAAGAPVDVQVVKGKLAADRVLVTLEYDPGLIPQGLNDKQVGMSVFDTELGSWVPILDAKVDPATRTVTAIAPHFSTVIATVLNAAKSAVDIGGKVIQTVIDANVTIARWITKLHTEILVTLLKDFLGIPEELKCTSTSPNVTVQAKSLLDLVRACAQPGEGSDTTVRLRNGFAFPLRTEPLPAGMAIRLSDVWNDGADVPNLVRNAFWAFRGQVVFPGTLVGSVTATSDLAAPVTVKMDIDADAVTFDMVLAALMVVGPAAAVAKSALKVVVEGLLKGAVKAEALTGWLKKSYEGLDCAVKAAHQVVDPFGKESIRAQADIAAGCVEQVLGALGLSGALRALISNVRILPEVVQTVLYPAAGQLGEQFGLYQQGPATVSVERFQVSSTFVGHWQVHGAVVDINRDGTGKVSWNGGPCTASLTEKRHCWGQAPLTFKAGANNTLVGTFGTVRYTTGEGGAVVTDYAFGSSGFQQGQTFSLWRNDEHTLKVSEGGPGNPYLCDAYASSHSNLCGA